MIISDFLYQNFTFESARVRLLKSIALVIGGNVALAASAKIQVPFWPIPMTMQSLVVLLIGINFGWRLGVATIISYLAEGFSGLPVFAGAAAGPVYLIGPTAGYLLGFLLGAAFIGWAGEKSGGRNLPKTFLLLMLGHVLIFVPGVIWLAVIFGWTNSFTLGILPFTAATLLKSSLGAAIVMALSKRSTDSPVTGKVGVRNRLIR